MVNKKQDFFTLAEVSEIIKLSKQSVREKILRGEIKATKVGREYRILSGEVNRILGVTNEKQEFEKDLKIKELESKVKHYEFVLDTLKVNMSAITSILKV